MAKANEAISDEEFVTGVYYFSSWALSRVDSKRHMVVGNALKL